MAMLWMRESKVESHFNDRVARNGGKTRKLKWVNRHSAPDRFTTVFQQVWLVELKRPGKKPRAAQARELARLNAEGANAIYLDTIEAIDAWIESIRPRTSTPKPYQFTDLLK